MSREISNRSKKTNIIYVLQSMQITEQKCIKFTVSRETQFLFFLKVKYQYKKANPFSKAEGIRFLLFTPQYSLTHYINPLVTTLSSFFLHTIVQAFQHQLHVPSYTQAYIYLLLHALTPFQYPQHS